MSADERNGFMTSTSKWLLALACLLMAAVPVVAQDADGGKNFGSPDAVDNQIADDAAPSGAALGDRLLQPWFDWKAGLQEKRGLSFGIDYSSVWMGSSEAGLSGIDDASSGMVRFFGSWDLFGRGTKNTGGLVWKVEHRHKYGDIPPFDFGFELGSVGMFVPPFSDQQNRVTNLYWRQRLGGGKVTLMAGFLDATDYLDVFAMASPWTGFVNFAFSTGTTTAFLPNDATLGLAAGAMLTDNLYIIGGITNAYADPRVPFRGFDYVSDGEYFKSLELGLTPSQGRIYHDNMHLTYWHVDASDKAGTPGGWGLNFQYVRTFNDKLMPFLRTGYADDGGSLMEMSASAGLGYATVGGRDQLGFAVNWGKPNESSFGSGLRDQYAMELFYRWQLLGQLAVTPDVQLLIDPALNPDHDSIWVYGVRARLAL